MLQRVKKLLLAEVVEELKEISRRVKSAAFLLD
jgi:hypothetical protein